MSALTTGSMTAHTAGPWTAHFSVENKRTKVGKWYFTAPSTLGEGHRDNVYLTSYEGENNIGARNAARIVACVNRCEGVSDKELAALEILGGVSGLLNMVGGTVSDAVTLKQERDDVTNQRDAMQKQIARLWEQRDELAAALRSCITDLRAERPGCVRLQHYSAVLAKLDGGK